MFHPAAALHQERYRALIEEDFRKLPDILAQAAAMVAPALAPTPPPVGEAAPASADRQEADPQENVRQMPLF